MKRVLAVLLLVVTFVAHGQQAKDILCSCGVDRLAELVQLEVIETGQKNEPDCKGIRLSCSDKKGQSVILPVKVCGDRSGKSCYFRLIRSGYETADFIFSLKDLLSAEVKMDSVFDENKRFLYIETDVYIKSTASGKLIGITMNGDRHIAEIFETVNGNQIRMHQLFIILTFDEKGSLMSKRREYLY